MQQKDWGQVLTINFWNQRESNFENRGVKGVWRPEDPEWNRLLSYLEKVTVHDINKKQPRIARMTRITFRLTLNF